jgi:hypothetical protein
MRSIRVPARHDDFAGFVPHASISQPGDQTIIQELSDGALNDLVDFAFCRRRAQGDKALEPNGSGQHFVIGANFRAGGSQSLKNANSQAAM